MDETRRQIAQMVENMRFERRKPVNKQTKAMLSALKLRLERPIADLNKLHLRLWHAEQKRSYYALSQDAAKAELTRIRNEIDAILKDTF